jgi:hypothetical protein
VVRGVEGASSVEDPNVFLKEHAFVQGERPRGSSAKCVVEQDEDLVRQCVRFGHACPLSLHCRPPVCVDEVVPMQMVVVSWNIGIAGTGNVAMAKGIEASDPWRHGREGPSRPRWPCLHNDPGVLVGGATRVIGDRDEPCGRVARQALVLPKLVSCTSASIAWQPSGGTCEDIDHSRQD